MKENLKDRFLLFLRVNNIAKANAERACGFGNGYFTQVKNISSEKLSRILDEYPQLNKNWLLTGEGEMLNHTYNATNNGTIIGGNNLNITQNNREAYLPNGFPIFQKWVSVLGSSMQPTFFAGDNIAIVECQKIFNGRYYYVETNDNSILCKLDKCDNGYTATYENITTSDFIADDDIKKIYRVVGILRITL